MNDDRKQVARNIIDNWPTDPLPPPDKMPFTTRRCPKCEALAYDIWKVYGLVYYKCAHCGHKGPNL